MNSNSVSIVTLAHRYKKLSKREAFAVLKRIIDRKEPCSDDNLARLYSFFLCSPIKSKYATDNFAWCTQAATNTNPVFDLRFLNVSGGMGYATDGHRLFYAPVSKDDGFYDVSGSKVDGAKFPQVHQLIEGSVKDPGNITHGPFKVHIREEHGQVYHAYNIGGVYINTKYFNEALAGLSPDEFTIMSNTETRMVRVCNHANDRVAIIMGLRIDVVEGDMQ